MSLRKMQARLSPDADLGPIEDGVAFYGHVLTAEWTDEEFDDAALAKAKGNRCIEVRETPKAPVKEVPAPVVVPATAPDAPKI